MGGWLGVRFTFRCRARRNDQDRLARVLENVVRNASQECTDACKTARSDHDQVDVEFARLADDWAPHVAVRFPPRLVTAHHKGLVKSVSTGPA
jgi:3-oxoacyl-ACP reductase-like protein